MVYLSTILCFIAVLGLIPLAKKFAKRSGYVDEPGGRKDHAAPIAPIGGLVIFPVYMVAMIVFGGDFSRLGVFFLGLIALLITGAFDEKKHLNAWLKFFIQLAVTFVVVVWGEARVYQLGNLFGLGDVGLTFMSIPFSMAAVMLLINAVNLMDGLDGLAAGYSFVALFWMVFACVMAGDAHWMMILAPLMGAVAGFLVYNMRHPYRARATVFLGDAGSMGLGLALSCLCIALAYQKHQMTPPILPPISVAWILALPIIDTCAQFYRRVREGKHPFTPDRGHFHHHFIHAGIPVGETTPAILGLAFILGAIGFLGVRLGLPQFVLTIGWIGLLFSHMALSRKPDIYIRLFSKMARD